MNNQSSVQKMFEIWYEAINNGTILVTMTKKGALLEIHKEVDEQFNACEKLHEQEIRNAFNCGIDEAIYKSSDRYDESKVKWHHSKDYYDKTFGNDTP